MQSFKLILFPVWMRYKLVKKIKTVSVSIISYNSLMQRKSMNKRSASKFISEALGRSLAKKIGKVSSNLPFKVSSLNFWNSALVAIFVYFFQVPIFRSPSNVSKPKPVLIDRMRYSNEWPLQTPNS